MSYGTRASLPISVVLLVLLLSTPSAHAREPGAATQEISTYPASEFRDSAPANAYDMLLRVPGFVIVDADADVRGYAGARGNVLIDGARPTSKHEDAKTLLKRIPSASVERIELIRGGISGIDMAGYAVLANIVRRHEATSVGALEGGWMASTDGWSSPQAKLEYSRRRDSHAFELAASISPELDDDSGRGTIYHIGPDGALQSRERLDRRVVDKQSELTGNWRRPLAGGQLTLTAAMRGERERTNTDLAGDDGDEVVRENEDTRQAEVGARYVRDLGDRTKLEMMATQHLGWLDDLEHSRDDDGDETFDQRTRTGESIARLDLTHAWSDTLSLTGSLEGAFNFLQSAAHLQSNGNAAALPGSNVRIKEKRVEMALGATWKPWQRWVLDAGLRVEKSAIEQTGDSPLTRRFIYPKPRAALQWDVGSRDQLRLSLSREVGQLDFSDFVASASLENNQVSAGNAELEPDKTWRMTAAWEHQFLTDAAFTVSWTHDRISDAVDRVLVITPDDVFDAPGNIGNGRRDTLALELSLPLDDIGFSGARLTSSMLWRRSRVTDPVAGQSRPISGEKPVEGQIALTQDLPAWNLHWGIALDHIAERKTKIRYDEVKRESEAMGWTVFVEHNLDPHWRLRAEVTDLFGRDFIETRRKYDGPRSTATLDEVERRRRRTPGVVSVTLRRSFGG